VHFKPVAESDAHWRVHSKFWQVGPVGAVCWLTSVWKADCGGLKDIFAHGFLRAEDDS